MPAAESCALDVAERVDGEGLTTPEIGALMGISDERARQIEVAGRAVLRLRMAERLRELAEGYGESEESMAAKKSKRRGAPPGTTKVKTNGLPLRKGVERKRYKDKLPVKIPLDRVAENADELAKVIGQREMMLEEKRQANAKFRDKIHFFDERLTELGESVRSKTEIRDVEVVEMLIVETNEIRIVRLDTGEIVSTRTAEVQDRQEALELDEEELEAGGFEDDDNSGEEETAGDAP